RKSGAEPAVGAQYLGLVADRLLDLLPLHSVRGIAEKVVVSLPGEGVLAEGVAEDDVPGMLALDHHVGAADGPGLRIDLLAERDELRGRIELVEPLGRGGQHAAGAARWVQHGLDYAALRERVGVIYQQEVDHEAHHLAGC